MDSRREAAFLCHMDDTLIIIIPVLPYRGFDLFKGPRLLSVNLEGLYIPFVLYSVYLDVVSVVE